MTEEIYELISLSIEVPYEPDAEEIVSKVCEDDPTQIEAFVPGIECDADGIPVPQK